MFPICLSASLSLPPNITSPPPPPLHPSLLLFLFTSLGMSNPAREDERGGELMGEREGGREGGYQRSISIISITIIIISERAEREDGNSKPFSSSFTTELSCTGAG